MVFAFYCCRYMILNTIAILCKVKVKLRETEFTPLTLSFSQDLIKGPARLVAVPARSVRQQNSEVGPWTG